MEQNKMNPIVSVIVPVYAGEKFICDCIDSILNQSFQEFELILIDDESPDRCGEICDDYATKDNRIRVIHQKNQGINKTRHNGVMAALGEWIVFVDDDDTLPSNSLLSLFEKTEGTDLVIGFPDTPVHSKDLSLHECCSNAITSKMFPPSPWAKMYRRSLFSDSLFNFPRGIDGEEDMIMNIRIIFSLTRAPHFVFSKVYNFRRNLSSVSHTKKVSVSHEVLFDEVRMKSLSNEQFQKFLPEIIWSRINGLYGVAAFAPDDICQNGEMYIETIKSDCLKINYRLGLLDRMLLNSNNRFVLKLIGFCRALYYFSKYHLGLNN